jgi:hypothetical protein
MQLEHEQRLTKMRQQRESLDMQVKENQRKK